jgi:hypothetical protein
MAEPGRPTAWTRSLSEPAKNPRFTANGPRPAQADGAVSCLGWKMSARVPRWSLHHLAVGGVVVAMLAGCGNGGTSSSKSSSADGAGRQAQGAEIRPGSSAGRDPRNKRNSAHRHVGSNGTSGEHRAHDVPVVPSPGAVSHSGAKHLGNRKQDPNADTGTQSGSGVGGAAGSSPNPPTGADSAKPSSTHEGSPSQPN